MIGRLKTYLGILAAKFSFLAGSHTCFSTTMVGSRAHKSAAIRQKCRIYNSEIGRYTIVGRNTLIQNCEIGHFTAISEGCNLGLPSHPTGMVSACAVFLKGSNYLKKNFAHFEWDECPRTSIGSDVWIGAHAQIKSGLTIGDGAVVAAGAVVTHDVAPYSVVAGVPARVIRMRFDDDKIRALQNTRWWDMDDAQIQKYAHLFDNPDALISALEGEKH